jgi:superfamily II DNA/RNA helicase
VLVPTRELANQVHAVIDRLARPFGLRSTVIFGGVGHRQQLAALRAGTDIVVGCPGRLADHLDQGALDLGGISTTVLDEADHMADVGFLPTVDRILAATPNAGQRLLFSATLAGGVGAIARRHLHRPVAHSVIGEAPPQMDHRVIVVASERRVTTILDVVGTQRGVVFTRTKHRARQLARTLSAKGLQAVELHGNLSQSARTTNLRAFATGTAQVLVATDIAARGIHIEDVPLVVHADVPIEQKAYVHRSGRTARAGSSGTVVTIARPDEAEAVKRLLRQSDVTATWDPAPTGGHARDHRAAPRRSARR